MSNTEGERGRASERASERATHLEQARIDDGADGARPRPSAARCAARAATLLVLLLRHHALAEAVPVLRARVVRREQRRQQADETQVRVVRNQLPPEVPGAEREGA